MAEQTKAYLSNIGEYTTFTFGGRTLTFLLNVTQALKNGITDTLWLWRSIRLDQQRKKNTSTSSLSLKTFIWTLRRSWIPLDRWRCVTPEEKSRKSLTAPIWSLEDTRLQKKDGKIAVLNINSPEYAMVLSLEGKLLETNMEPVEQALILIIWEKNSYLMEDDNA